MDVYTQILEKIRAEQLPLGARLPSERSLAEGLHISRTAVRAALGRLIAEGWLEALPGCRPTLKRVFEEVTPQKKWVALLMGSEKSYKPFALLLRSVEAELWKFGYFLVYVETGAEASCSQEVQAAREAEAIMRLVGQGASGVLIWCQSPQASLPLLQQLQREGTAVVTLDKEIPGLDTDHVGVNSYRASQELVHYLLSANHQAIAFAAEEGNEASTIRERLEGYLAEMRAQTPLEPEVIYFPYRATSLQIAQVFRPLQEQGKLPTAIFVENDLYAYRVAEALVEHLNLKVPEDISLVGFDDMEPEKTYTLPLTTMRQPFSEMGKTAVRILQQRIEEPDAPTKQVLLKTELVERSSVVSREKT